jgi:hypothetical protein
MVHWSDRYQRMPAAERQKFLAFDTADDAWRACEDGAALIWLAQAASSDETRRTEIRRAAAEAAFQITESLYRYWSGTEFREFNDPVVLAHHNVLEGMFAATGFYRPGERAASPTWLTRADEYARVLHDLLRLTADVVRNRLGHPAAT